MRLRNITFSHELEIVNFENIIDHEELLTLKPKSQYLSGENQESIKIIVSMEPLLRVSFLFVT